jgi:hypothetical protein
MKKNNYFWVYFAISTALTCYHLIFKEYIPLNNGFGFEGYSIYLPLTKYFAQLVGQLDSYSIQRILPFSIAWALLKVFNNGGTITDGQVFNFWIVLNYIELMLICYVWHRLSSHLKLTFIAAITGFSILVLNFATAKLDYYYNFNYDRLALLFGLLILYSYIKNNKIAIAVLSILSISVWPTFLPLNIILITFPVSQITKLNADANIYKIINYSLPVMMSLAVMVSFFIVYLTGNINRRPDLAEPVDAILPVSIILAGLFIFVVLLYVVKKINVSANIVAQFKINYSSALTIFLMVCAYIMLTKFVANPGAANRLNLADFVSNVATGAIQRPLQFIAAHILYFGPGIYLLFALRRQVIIVLESHGVGLILLAIIASLQFLNSESRQMINLLPLIALITAQSIENIKADYKFLTMVLFSSLVLSKFWLKINPDPLEFASGYITNFPMVGNSQLFPAQKYFMNFGPWMSTEMLLIQSAVVAILCSGIYLTLKKQIEKAAP